MTALIIESALRALVFALAVGAGLRVLRVRNVPVRKASWSLVLIASLAMPFLLRTPAVSSSTARWGWTLPLPLRPWVAEPSHAASVPLVPLKAAAAPVILAAPASSDAPDTTAAERTAVSVPIAIAPEADSALGVAPAAATEAPARAFHWPPANRLIPMIYLSVAGILFLRLLWGLAMALRLWATADLVSPLVAPEPNVRSSPKIPSPVTIGSGIVLPASYTEWDRKKLRMVIAHERSHVRQMDFYLQFLAGLYTAVFWFSPLGWWLRRTLASLGEAIGDRAGMDAAASGSRYAEVLLEFAAMPHRSLPGVAMARRGSLSPRVDRLLNEHLFRSAFAEGRRRALVSLLLIPAALVAATILIRVPFAAAQTAPHAPAAPTPATPAAPAPAPAAPAPLAVPGIAPVPAVLPDPELPSVPSLPQAPASAVPAPDIQPPAVAPELPVPPDLDPVFANSSRRAPSIAPYAESADNYSSSQDAQDFASQFSDRGDSWAVVEGPGNELIFSGDWNGEQHAEIEAARKVAHGPFLWFMHDGKAYVVTDPAVIAKIRAMYKPMDDLGRKQELLGKQQEALGRQMEELARQQAAAGQVRMPDLSKEIADMNAAMAKAKTDQDNWNTKELAEAEAKLKAAQDRMLSSEQMAELQAKLAVAQSQWHSEAMADLEAKMAEMQARLGELQGEAGARQGRFGAQMGDLGSKQGALGAQQGRLGAEQGRLGQQIHHQVQSIIQDCLRTGKATQVPQ